MDAEKMMTKNLFLRSGLLGLLWSTWIAFLILFFLERTIGAVLLWCLPGIPSGLIAGAFWSAGVRNGWGKKKTAVAAYYLGIFCYWVMLYLAPPTGHFIYDSSRPEWIPGYNQDGIVLLLILLFYSTFLFGMFLIPAWLLVSGWKRVKDPMRSQCFTGILLKHGTAICLVLLICLPLLSKFQFLPPAPWVSQSYNKKFVSMVREGKKLPYYEQLLTFSNNAKLFPWLTKSFFWGEHFQFGYFHAGEIKASVSLYERYYLEMEIPIQTNFLVTRIKSFSEPRFFLAEIKEHYWVKEPDDSWSSPGQSTLIPADNNRVWKIVFTENNFTFGLEEWNELMEHEGDFSVLDIPIITDSPVPHGKLQESGHGKTPPESDDGSPELDPAG